jgi:excisionase family DNA binding protein
MAETFSRLLTLLEVADTLRLSPHTIRSLVRQGKLHPTRICRRLLFSPADVEQLIARSITN